MKRLLIIGAVLVIALGPELMAAEPIDSKVIHHYTYVGAGYGYLHDLTDGLNAHGVTGVASIEAHNVVLGVSGGHFWGDDDLGLDADVTLWNVGANLGYVVRLIENHLNIIPRFGVSYGEVKIDIPSFGEVEGDSWAISPGVALSYAINNRLALGGSYGWVYDLDTEDDTHVFGVGTKVALAEQVGLNVGVSFAESVGFAGVTAGLEFHF